MKTHLMIPDTQVTPDTPMDHLNWIGQYIVDEKPDVIVQIGDFADMESLSYFDRGKRAIEGRRVIKDIEAAHTAMGILTAPLRDLKSKRRNKYDPEMHLTLGNHEYRIERATEDNAQLYGLIGMESLEYDNWGWEVHDFLTPVCVDGIHYSHYFVNPTTGRPYGGQSIDTRLKNIGFTFTMGHQQVLMVGQRFLNNGTRIRGLVAGSCYLHDEDYRGAQSNGEWRGVIMKHEVCAGSYDLMEVSLDYLCRRYEGVELWEFMEKSYPSIFRNSLWLNRSKEARTWGR